MSEVIHASGKREFFKDGRLHSAHGPAIIHADGRCEWYLNGVRQPDREAQPAADIVVRLRAGVLTEGDGAPSIDHAESTMLEAASEIERLRTLLKASSN